MNGRTSTEKAEHLRLLRARAEELRDMADKMKSREARSTLTILAQSYDRMADELDRPDDPASSYRTQAKA